MTKGYRLSQRMRKRMEELSGEAKEFMGLRRAKFRGVKFARESINDSDCTEYQWLVKLLTRKGLKRKPVHPQQHSYLPANS